MKTGHVNLNWLHFFHRGSSYNWIHDGIHFQASYNWIQNGIILYPSLQHATGAGDATADSGCENSSIFSRIMLGLGAAEKRLLGTSEAAGTPASTVQPPAVEDAASEESSSSDESESLSDHASCVSCKYVTPRGASGVKVAHVLDRARQICLDIVPAAMTRERAEKLRRADAEDEETMQTWRGARCGCEHHGGACLSYLYDNVGMGRLVKRRLWRYELGRKKWQEKLTEIVDTAATTTTDEKGDVVVTLDFKIHGHRVCADAWCHASHVSLHTVKRTARDVGRVTKGFEIAPRRRRRTTAEKTVRNQQKAWVHSWAFHRTVSIAQPAPNLAAKVKEGAVDNGGELQMRRRRSCCERCRSLKKGQRRIGACSPAVCEYGIYISETTLTEEQTAGKSLFRREYEAAREEAGVVYRRNLCVTGDCSICSTLETEVRPNGVYVCPPGSCHIFCKFIFHLALCPPPPLLPPLKAENGAAFKGRCRCTGCISRTQRAPQRVHQEDQGAHLCISTGQPSVFQKSLRSPEKISSPR